MTTKPDRFTPYQIKLFVFLSVATFFEGYDFFALTQILPTLREDMNLSHSDAGFLITFINIGTVLAYVLVRKADRWGRRRLLSITIAGYTTFTFITAFAPDVYTFAICQFIARTFLIAEWSTSMVYAAEEFPARRRGLVIGVISASSSLGGVLCAGVVPLLLHTPFGWRSVYLIGIIPLILLAFARRSLRESRRFAEQVDTSARRSMFHIFRTPYRKRLLYMALIWGVTYICTQTGVAFWKDFALTEGGLSEGQAGLAIVIAALVSMPLVFAVGHLLDRIGRKPGALLIFSLASAGTVGAYQFTGQWPLTGALLFALFGASAVIPVLNAFTTELFPTDLRGDAFAWANNLLGRITYVTFPAIVGVAAEDHGWSNTISLTAIGPIIAMILIVTLLPETTAKELEETAAIDE